VTPADINLSYEDVFLELPTVGKLHAWYIPCGNSSDIAPTVLFCHGNAGNISHRLETAEFVFNQEANLLLFDYRGYGQSDGKPDEEGIYADAEAWYYWLVENRNISPERIVPFGRSLGGAVAIDLASRLPCGGLIVESSFTSAKDMGQRMFPILPVKFLLRFDFNSLEKINKVTCPVLVTHSPQDEIIPFEMGEKLYDAVNSLKKFVKLRGGHNERLYLQDQSYETSVRELLRGDPDW